MPPDSDEDNFDSDVVPVTVTTGMARPAMLAGRAEIPNLVNDDLAVDAGVKLPENVEPASIEVSVWHDSDKDGVRGTDEGAISAVTVQIVSTPGDVIQAQKQTGSDGKVVVPYLAPGTYYARILARNGYTYTLSNRGTVEALDSDVTSPNGATNSVTIAGGQTDRSLAAGLVLPTVSRPVSLRGKVWLDADGGNTQSEGEAGISAARVELYDATGAMLAFATTGASGEYSFINLAPGSYGVRILPPSGYAYIAQNIGTDDVDSDVDPIEGRSAFVPIASGSSAALDAGVRAPIGVQPGSLSGYAWIDDDRDGIRDSVELFAAGLRVRLFSGRGELLAFETTDAGGYYAFVNLPPGTYYVDIAPPINADPSPAQSIPDTTRDSDLDQYGRTRIVTLTAGQNLRNIDGGWMPEVPTAIVLEEFDAQPAASGVDIRWRTSLEVNTLGFRLLRSRTLRLADAVYVSEDYVIARGAAGGASYELHDPSGAAGDFYWLEETETNGTVNLYGPDPVRATAVDQWRRFLPMIGR